MTSLFYNRSKAWILGIVTEKEAQPITDNRYSALRRFNVEGVKP